MKNVLEHMSKERLLVLAALMELHDPKDAAKVTSSHISAATGGMGKVPFSAMSDEAMRREIGCEVSALGGHSVVNFFRGGGVTYREIVCDVAKHVGIEPAQSASSVRELEGLIAQQALRRVLEKMSPEQRAALEDELADVASKHGKSFAAEGGVLAALAAANLSGFGIYIASSTVVGGITGLLGITLPFGFYTGMSSVLATVTGPIGWTVLGALAVYKLGGPNMKKLLPVVLFIAAERYLLGAEFQDDEGDEAPSVPARDSIPESQHPPIPRRRDLIGTEFVSLPDGAHYRVYAWRTLSSEEAGREVGEQLRKRTISKPRPGEVQYVYTTIE